MLNNEQRAHDIAIALLPYERAQHTTPTHFDAYEAYMKIFLEVLQKLDSDHPVTTK